MKLKKIILGISSTIVLLVAGLSYTVAGLCADKSNSTQQALEQLRQLQQRMSPTAAATPPQPAGESRPIAAVNAVTVAGNGILPTTSENDSIDSLAFDDVKEQLFPLSPEQLLRVKQEYQTHEYAKTSTVGMPPRPAATSQFVNLSPGSTPPVIRLSQGFVSSLVFLDSTGAPWPISAYDLGDPSSFNVQWDKTSNTLIIQASTLYTYGNLAVRLRGLNTPVMLTLIPGQKAVDYRVDLRVQGYGPNAKPMTMDNGLPPSASDILLRVLDGVPPGGQHTACCFRWRCPGMAIK